MKTRTKTQTQTQTQTKTKTKTTTRRVAVRGPNWWGLGIWWPILPFGRPLRFLKYDTMMKWRFTRRSSCLVLSCLVFVLLSRFKSCLVYVFGLSFVLVLVLVLSLVLSSLVLCSRVLSGVILSRFWSCLLWCCFVLPCLMLSYVLLSVLGWSYLVLVWFVLVYLAVCWAFLSCLVVASVSSFLGLYHLRRRVLLVLVFSGLVLPCLVLTCLWSSLV